MHIKIRQLAETGQSLWYDNISRDLLDSGAINALVDEGLSGMTSNPTIFQQAISGGTAYDSQIQEMAGQGASAEEIYEALAIADIQRAADILRPVYERTEGLDGYISLEVSPFLAHDTAATIAEVSRLRAAVNRPNLMVKIPATPEGIPAIADSIAAGYNINVTLIFSRDVYAQVMNAYLTGLERRADQGQPIDGLASVASFFVSRIDSLVDDLLDKIDTDEARDLRGMAAIANARLAYQLWRETFNSERFQKLQANGARYQRPLWASTSTKNPHYRDVMYIEQLIGSHTVNTAPPHTIEAFKDHGEVGVTIEQDLVGMQSFFAALAEAGIDMQAVTAELLQKGVKSFSDSFQKLLDAIEEKRQQFVEAPAA